MSDVMFDWMGGDYVLIKNIAVPRMNEEVFIKNRSYKVILIKHFPEGGKGVLMYKSIKQPFVRVSLMNV